LDKIEKLVPNTLCRKQADWCRRLGSPFYAYLLERSAEDYERGGPVRDLLEPHREESRGIARPLQMMGAVHRLVLEGRAPALARYYPSVGGSVDLDPAWQSFRETVAMHRDRLHELIRQPVQTNDAGRSGSLLGGFLLVAQLTGLPLRLLEIGSSAGLNLCWDLYRYTWQGGAWGDPASPLVIEDVFAEGAPPSPDSVIVASRTGCDPSPVDARSAEGRLTLLSYTWPDQVDRIRRLETAIEIARGVSYQIDRASAAEWLALQLAHPAEGVVSAVYHSVVWPYLSEDERGRVATAIETAGERATSGAPLAWLRMEPGGAEAEISLRIYPGFAERVIATCSFHTPAVRWLDSTISKMAC
jgi:hypothetical protein